MKTRENKLEIAKKSLESSIRKNEKVYQTMSLKETVRPGQLKMLVKQINVHYIMLALINNELGIDIKEINEVDLNETREEIFKLMAKIEKVMVKFKEGTAQYTLAKRRILSFQLSLDLIEKKQKGEKNEN